jgi:hypothetical protein
VHEFNFVHFGPNLITTSPEDPTRFNLFFFFFLGGGGEGGGVFIPKK